MVKIKKSIVDVKKLNAYLSHVYTSPNYPGSFSGLDKLYREVRKEFPNVSQKDVQLWAKDNLSYALHRPARRAFKHNQIYAPEIDSLWEADLVFVQDVAKQNNGVKYLLVAIDVLSKYAWVSPMKDKKGKSLIAAFNSILKKGRKPEKLRTDKGTEFVNVSFQNYLKKEGIDFYVATNEPKAAVVERLNRTLKSKLYHYFTSENTLHYIDDLQDIVDSYNNTYHRSIAQTPASVNLLNVGSV